MPCRLARAERAMDEDLGNSIHMVVDSPCGAPYGHVIFEKIRFAFELRNDQSVSNHLI